MTLLDMLQSPNPELPGSLLHAVLTERYGLSNPRIAPLGSTQDQNLRVEADGRRFVLKVANQATELAELALQNAAMQHMAEAGMTVPLPISTVDGESVVELEGHLVRLASWVPGVPLAGAPTVGTAELRALGAVAAECVDALATFRHGGLGRVLQWDPAHALRVTELLASTIMLTAAQRAAVQHGVRAMLSLEVDGLPVQAVHLDVTDYNVVGVTGPSGGFELTGVIDVGDVVSTWRVAELAHAAASSVLHTLSDPLVGIVAVVEGFVDRVPLGQGEVEAVWALILARAVVTTLSSTHQAELTGASDHLSRLMHEDWATLHALCGVDAAEATEAIAARGGHSPG